MNELLNIVITIIALVMAIYISRVLVHQLGKLLSAKHRPYLFLVVAAIPLYEIIRSLATYSLHIVTSSFFYFWVVFLIAMLTMFFKEFKKVN